MCAGKCRQPAVKTAAAGQATTASVPATAASAPAQQDSILVLQSAMEANLASQNALAARISETAEESQQVDEVPEVKVPVLALQSGR